MNLKCKLCDNEALWDCRLINNLVCDACCGYDLQSDVAPVIVQRCTKRELSYSKIDKICQECGKRK